MSEKELTFEEKKALLDAMSTDTPWIKPEITELHLKVKVIWKHCAQKVYGRNLSKMLEAHIIKQMRADGILPPVGVPLVKLPDPGEEAKLDEPEVIGARGTLTLSSQPEAKRKITRIEESRSLTKKRK